MARRVRAWLIDIAATERAAPRTTRCGVAVTTLTVVIPTRGLEPLLRVCLDCLAAAVASATRAEPLAARVVVVDNATPYPIRLAAGGDPPVEVLRFDAHQPFAVCCTARSLRPRRARVLLNNDVLLDPQALTEMLAVIAADPMVAICGTRLVFPDGRLQHAGVRFAPTLGPYHHERGRDAATVSRMLGRLQAVTGACMLIRGVLWDELGGLDESYPFGLEDIDFCLAPGAPGGPCCAQRVESLHFESMTPGRVELDAPSRRLFMERWQGRYTIDGDDPRD